MNRARTMGGRHVAALWVAGMLATAGACGKKGPPLPPLNRVPVSPADFSVVRRSDRVDIQLKVPDANTDGSRPANIDRVEIYAFTGPAAITDDQIWRRGTRLATFRVKAPKNPDDTIEPDDPIADLEPLEGPGLDQGTVISLHEDLSAPATPASTADDVRLYVSFGVAKNGRKGPLSRRGRVPLTSAPAAPTDAAITYDEKGVTVTWSPLAADKVGAGATLAGYSVYDVSPRPPSTTTDVPTAGADAVLTPQSLSPTPVKDARFVDSRVEWGARRCYAVRTIEQVAGATIESAPSPDVCVTLIDTFPPAPPKGLSVLPSSGGTAMQLIWDGNTEPDLAGYIVLRGVAPAETLTPITPQLISEPSFSDTVQPGNRYVYAVQAVDKSGNRSAPSDRKEETAR